MIMYSIVPTEEIFKDMQDFHPCYEEISMGGMSMQIERLGEDQARIVRIYSTNPQDFLNPQLSPGTILSYGATMISNKH